MERHTRLQGRLVGGLSVVAMGLLLGLALSHGGAVASGPRTQDTSQASQGRADRAEMAGAGRIAGQVSAAKAVPTETVSPCGQYSNYVITPSTEATVVAGTTLVPGSQGDNVVAQINLPFIFGFYEQGVNRAYADSNGDLQFVSSTARPDNTCLPAAVQDYWILAYWDDLDTSSSITSSLGPLGVYTSVSGTAPNRIFNIEWRACLHGSGACGGEANFEVRLHESGGTFDIVYGAVPGGGSGVTVGAQTRAGDRYTQYQCETGELSPGLLLNFSFQTCPPTPTETPVVYDSFAHLEPAAPTPLVVNLNSKFTLDLFINSGESGLNLASAQQSYLTFTYSLLQNVRADSAGCVPSNRITAITDTGFDTEIQNNACNGPGACNQGIAPAGSIAFASGSLTNPAVSGDFRVARMAFCGIWPGTAIIHWQFSPEVPLTRDSEIVSRENVVTSNPALYNGGNRDYVVQIVGDTPTPTKTKTPTASPTPTSTTPTATPARVIRGHVVWQGRPPQPHLLQQLPITMTLRLQSSGAASELTNLSTDPDGYFTADVTSLVSGDYDVRVKGPQFLVSAGTVTLSGAQSTPLEMYDQRTGDCNNDNAVGAADFNILKSTFGSLIHDPWGDGRADLNGDQLVSSPDFLLLRSNFGQGGADPLSGNRQR